ncbi:MAG: DUF3124 domain-containing protein [Nitrospirota bacterium]
MITTASHRYKLLFYSMVFSILLSPVFVQASDENLSSGETLYIPVYSNVYSGPKANPLQLATMLSMHNIDPKYSITILKVDYYDSSGKFIESYIKNPVHLKPFAHTFFYLKEYDTRGGPGANFVVKWRADKKINQPVVEALMLGARAGISFTSAGRIITDYTE